MIGTIVLETNREPVRQETLVSLQITPDFSCPLPLDMDKTRKFVVYVRGNVNQPLPKEIESVLEDLENSTSMKPEVISNFLYLCRQLNFYDLENIQLDVDPSVAKTMKSQIDQELQDISTELEKLGQDPDLSKEITFSGTCLDILSGWAQSILNFLMFFLNLVVLPSEFVHKLNDYSASGNK